MPVKILRKEFVMPKRDWARLSQAQKYDLLKDLNLIRKYILLNYNELIKISQNFTKEYATEPKDEIKGLQVIKFEK